jgi:hypothetical protein
MAVKSLIVQAPGLFQSSKVVQTKALVWTTLDFRNKLERLSLVSFSGLV